MLPSLMPLFLNGRLLGLLSLLCLLGLSVGLLYHSGRTCFSRFRVVDRSEGIDGTDGDCGNQHHCQK